MRLHGREEVTLELGGTIPLDAARRLLAGTTLAPETAGDTDARVHLLAFQMRGLRPRGLPAALGSDYREALWRLGVVWEGRPAWLAVACDLDRALVRTLGSWLVRYPVVAARIAFASPHGVQVDAHGLSFRASAAPEPGSEPPPAPPRRTLVRQAGALFEIPWEEEPAPWRREAHVTIESDARARAAFGLQPGEALAWGPRGLVQAGRGHRCGLARRVAPGP